MKKHFCSKIKNPSTKSIIFSRYSPQFTDLFQFKLKMNKLLEKKIFHYSILNNSVNELSQLNQLTKRHSKILYNLENNFKNLCMIDETTEVVNLSSLSLGYKEFLDFIKYLHEQKEDDINNIIRDMIENNLSEEEINKILIEIRDDWRECLNPELLDESLNPIRNLSLISRVSLEANKLISKLLI